MPKQVKKPTRKRLPKDVNQHAAALVALTTEERESSPVIDFDALYRAHMSKLGKKGGDISGERRMSLPVEVRRRVASTAARAMWAKRKAAKKR